MGTRAINKDRTQDISITKERAILVGLQLNSRDGRDIDDSLDELEQLALTAGASVVGRVKQTKEKPHVRTYIGPGKTEEVRLLADTLDADLIIFDDDLTPSQQHNLEDTFRRRVLDRTALILDIFAQHAHSREGKLQVELAQLNYRLPRLTGRGVELSRMGGGIGTRRGPGEQKLEVDRRRIRQRIGGLKRELEHVAQNRSVQRKKREKAGVFSVSLVGYTNTGKSTLLNALTDAEVLVEDKLFATLDSTTRRLVRANDLPLVLSDTVGFIHKLPHQLVAAFRSTLEEVRKADLLVHVVDASHPHMREQMRAVDDVLGQIGASGYPTLTVFNKQDLLDEENKKNLQKQYPDAVLVSARTREGLDKLIEEIERRASAHFSATSPQSRFLRKS